MAEIEVAKQPGFNSDIEVYASAARTATPTSVDIFNHCGAGIHIILDVTVDPASASITLKLEGKDPTSGKFYTILEGAAVISVSTNVYIAFPGAAETANVSANDFIPSFLRITVTHVDTDSITYSVGINVNSLG